MLLLYSTQISARFSYITKLIFTELLGIEISTTISKVTFINHQSAQINYSNDAELPGLKIVPWNILFREDIKPYRTKTGAPWYGLPTIMLDDETTFDPLAMAFYLVSRYEEYGNYSPDAHNRFPAEASCLVKHNLLHKPLVNQWALRLLDLLKDKYPQIVSKPYSFRHLSTIDIDQAWKYRNKGVLRNWGAAAREIYQRDWQALKLRWGVLSGYENDPFYNYDWQDSVHKEYNVEVQYFVQVGGFSQFDKSISTQNFSFRSLIERLDEKYKVGIHPSYQSNKKHELVQVEKKTLENIVRHEVKVSRQHYLMHTMPETYLRLMEAGIEEDHTMGYSTHIGFRAGIAAPFHFFNLQTNTEENLVLIPFCLMDITPLHYLSQSPEEAKETIADIIWEVKNVGGLFVNLWHNESLSEDGRWKDWREVYEYMVAEAR